ncbi:hypothetical protein GCM10022243_25470 [Saccharothrix violaceirubra]|uniref:Transposase n=1 Tax=Saccharothrix violaceirubra TaxID=413306 RepID=A0A7W7WW59_9PSEU|nr:transposase [Saccharothrix violaceirubra]
MDAILDTVDNGIKWRALTADFPPWNTVYRRFAAWEPGGAAERLLNAVRDRARLKAGHVAAPRQRRTGDVTIRVRSPR